ncbi:uncharacterized protein LOC143027639 isoform X1 [Oratosquilla oratoria]|uniref:uncharacterized protein LOC143027639 isoform X1 n=1 Tax=Oratosquilla oratoria TaxID=337810 RepID=UPI003F75B347
MEHVFPPSSKFWFSMESYLDVWDTTTSCQKLVPSPGATWSCLLKPNISFQILVSVPHSSMVISAKTRKTQWSPAVLTRLNVHLLGRCLLLETDGPQWSLKLSFRTYHCLYGQR